MCKQPLRIPNPKRDYDPQLHSQYIYVPCGHCSDCRKKQRDEWFPRLVEEFHNFNLKGSIWFPTLTYRNEELPYYINEKRNYKIPCFNYKDVQIFIKKLRVYLTRMGLDCSGLKYFVASEYGSKKGRPHYHALLYLPFRISPVIMAYLFRKCWIKGFVGSSKKGLEIQSVDAVAYCAKYVNKDQVFEHVYGIHQFLKTLLDERKKVYNSDYNSPTRESNLEALTAEISEFRKVIVRHYQSTNFGKSILKQFVTPDGYDIDKLISGHLNIVGAKKSYNIPSYILRQILYDKVWTHIEHDGQPECNEEPKLMYVLNDVGKQYYTRLYDDTIHNQNELFSAFFDRNIMASFHIPSQCGNPVEVCDYINTLLGNRPIELLTIYSLCYENKRLPIEPDYDGNYDLASFDTSLIHDNAFDYWLSSKCLNINILYPTSAYKCSRKFFKNDLPTYNMLPIFHDFDEILQLIHDLVSIDSQIRSMSVFKHELEVNLLKDNLNNYVIHKPISQT